MREVQSIVEGEGKCEETSSSHRVRPQSMRQPLFGKTTGRLVQSFEDGLDSETRNRFPCLRIRYRHHEVPHFSLSMSQGGGPTLISVISSTRL
jgi:hypothetical protein